MGWAGRESAELLPATRAYRGRLHVEGPATTVENHESDPERTRDRSELRGRGDRIGRWAMVGGWTRSVGGTTGDGKKM